MPGIPDVVVKAPVFGRLETLIESLAKDSPIITAAISRLEAGDSIVDVAKANGLYADDAAAAHLKRDWLDSPAGTGWWHPTDTDGIMRKGLVKALRRFQATGKPFEVFWVISGSTSAAPWVMSITEGKRQITIMFHTPRYAAGVVPVEQDDMWVSVDEGGDIDVRNVLGPPPPPPKVVPKKKGPKKKKKKKKKKTKKKKSAKKKA